MSTIPIKTAVMLAAGEGAKVWPYAAIRPKAMIPLAGKPIAAHQAELLGELGFERLIIVGGRLSEQLVHYFANSSVGAPAARLKVTVVKSAAAGGVRGTAFSLLAAEELIGDDEPFLVLYGDTVLEKSDIARLIDRFASGGRDAAVLVAPLRAESPGDWICCRLKPSMNTDVSAKGTNSASGTDDRVSAQKPDLGGQAAADESTWLELDGIMGHPRDGYTHRFCAFAFRKSILNDCAANSGIFSNVQVGMMPPLEGQLEMTLADRLAGGQALPAVEALGAFFDIDKPWHILQANEWLVKRQCSFLTAHELAEGASIDDSAAVNGFVRLGRNSRIGRNVIINGSVIAGDNTTIENGAILQGDHVIGSDTYIGNYCFLSSGSTVGSRCVVNHCAELDGLIMDNVYLYHYMEFYGIIGTSTDLGAATVCGTLRFDDGNAVHRIRGRRENPREHANATYLGDYVRTGVNAILMPGVKVGAYSVVGPGVLLQEDVPDRTIVSVKQELSFKEWGPHRYGW